MKSKRQTNEELENPELLILRARKLYENRGYSRRWIDKRLHGVSARQELTGEWHKRGAAESDQYRRLTNALMRGGFGMNVERYRRYKNLTRPHQNLRDHMSDLELALTVLGETAAVALHQARDSQGFDKLKVDARDAGRIVARTRRQIERLSGRPIVNPAHHLHLAGSRSRMPRSRRPTRELAERAYDTDNRPTPPSLRTVA